jgi:ionotropic glutamate receptor
MAKQAHLLLLFLFFVCSNFEFKVNSLESNTTLKLKIGVPMRKGFKEFVQVLGKINGTENYSCSGFSIEVFAAAARSLPFNVEYEFIPFQNKTGQSNGSYNELLRQINAKIIDGVAGDTTIIFNRTSFVDFTLPYTESGVTMLVSNKQRKSMWVVVKPFSWDLWLAMVIVSIFIGLVLMILERHNTNDSASASPKWSVGTLFWLPMASAVSSQGDKVISNCSKFVLVVWLFLTFVLMQSYSASLSSMLTVDQLLPTYTSVDQLRKGGYFIGYQKGSFVGSLLTDKLGFSPSKLIPYSTIDEYHDALSKGSKNGGVAAIFGEIPYIRMFLGKHSSDFMMAGPTYRTGGFGFAFHLNSTLVPHFSRAILNISDGNNMMDELETKYFGHTLVPSNYQSTSTTENSSPLTAYNFGGLFICIRFATLLALLVSESYIWRVPLGKAKQFSQRIYFSFSSSNKAQIANDPTESVDGNLELPDINNGDISIDLQDHVRI